MTMYRATAQGQVPFTPEEEQEEVARIAVEKAKIPEPVLSIEGLANLVVQKLSLTTAEKEAIFVPVTKTKI